MHACCSAIQDVKQIEVPFSWPLLLLMVNFAVAVNNRIAPQTRTADDENCDKINSQ